MDNAITELEKLLPEESQVFKKLSNAQARFVMLIIIDGMEPGEAVKTIGYPTNPEFAAVNLMAMPTVERAITALLDDRLRSYGRVLAHRHLYKVLQHPATTERWSRTKTAAAKVVLEHCRDLDKDIKASARAKEPHDMTTEELEDYIHHAKMVDITPPSKDELMG